MVRGSVVPLNFKPLLVLTILILFLGGAFALTFYTERTDFSFTGDTISIDIYAIMIFRVSQEADLYGIRTSSGADPTTCGLFDDTGATLDTYDTHNGNDWNFTTPYTMSADTNYVVGCTNTTAGWTYNYENGITYPFTDNLVTWKSSGWIQVGAITERNMIRGKLIDSIYIESPSDSVTASFDSNVNFFNGNLELTDTSTSVGVTIDDWNWLVDSVLVSTDQNYNYATSQSQDLNVCLRIADSTDVYEDITCSAISTGKWINSFLHLTEDKANTRLAFYDDSNTEGLAIASWSWLVDSVEVGTTQDFNWDSATQLTDYNIALQVSNAISSDLNFIAYQTGDWEAPATTMAYAQVNGTNITQLTFTCVDNNIGCATTTYQVNGGAWSYLANTGTADVNIIGTGVLAINYFSSDNSDNNETAHISSATAYGFANIRTINEVSEATESGVSLDFNTETFSLSPSVTIPLEGLATATYTLTFTKTDFATRTYSIDLNQYSMLDLNFLMLDSNASVSVPFTIYEPDQTTIFSDVWLTLYRPDKSNFIAGRVKSSATGTATFNINTTDQNYYTDVNGGGYNYTAVTLLVKYPKNELTLAQIDENWSINITQNLFVSYTELNDDKIVYLLPNTTLPFNLKIADMNGNYFSRTYAMQYLGNPSSDTLQPYLVPLADGVLTTIYTQNATSNTTLSGVEIRIYKYISGLGRTLVEQVLTDSKGQALTLLVAGAEYEFETYYNGTFVKTFNITATSTSIYILLTIPETIPDVDPSGWAVNFTPNGSGLISSGVGTTTFTQKAYNFGGISTTYTSTFIVNGVVISTQTYTGTDSTYTFTHIINNADMNKSTAISRLIVNGGTAYTYQQTYNVTSFYDTNYSIMDGLRTGLRSDFACSGTGVCFTLLLLALFVSIGLVVSVGMIAGQFGSQASIITFAVAMIGFTYLYWVPVELTAMVVLIGLSFMAIERRG